LPIRRQSKQLANRLPVLGRREAKGVDAIGDHFKPLGLHIEHSGDLIRRRAADRPTGVTSQHRGSIRPASHRTEVAIGLLETMETEGELDIV
jgi:hypothetical protein